jgi:putative phosphoesterase
MPGNSRRIAALYDIHGNLPALDAVLSEVRNAGVDQIVIGGDVLPGPMPRECLDRLYALDTPTTLIVGNGDRETLAYKRGDESGPIPPGFREAIRWNAAQLTASDEVKISAWPSTCRFRVDGIGDVVFCHATPRNDVEIFTAATAEEKLLPIFSPLGADLVVCGHVHMQFDRMIGRTRVVNAGSVGMPFEDPGAYWLLIGPGINLRRTEYDRDDAAARVRRTAYPQAEEFAAKSILTAPNRDAMIAAFANAELQN